MPSYLAPGVYVEETSFRAPSIEGVGTSTAGFVGPTLTGPIGGTPSVLTSFGDYANIYGDYDNLAISATLADPKNINYMALGVKGFFDNGGSVLYVSRVFAGGPGVGVAKASDADVTISAAFPGNAGNRTVTISLVSTLTPVPTGTTTTLPQGSLVALVTPPPAVPPALGAPAPAAASAPDFFTNGATGAFKDAGGNAPSATLPQGAYFCVLTMQVSTTSASGAPVSWSGLGFDPLHPMYIGNVLGAVPPRSIDALGKPNTSHDQARNRRPQHLQTNIFAAWSDPTKAVAKTYTLTGGTDGAEPASIDYDNALKAFEALEDIAIVAAPGSSIFTQSAAIIQSLVTHVSRPRAYRVAVLDTPPNQVAADNEAVRGTIDTSYAALYVPWITVANPLSRAGTAIAAQVSVPPSGYIAGIYARSDAEKGVAKAPANEVVLGALGLERGVTFGEQSVLNPLGINCIRSFPERGLRVWGARTASSDSEFMYLNVRRFLVYLEHSIDNSTQWAVFENNGPALWARVRESVEQFLYSELQAGNLLGATPAQAYFVRCDCTTMTQNDLDNGRLICLIGVALLKPAEFVVFRIGQFIASARC